MLLSHKKILLILQARWESGSDQPFLNAAEPLKDILNFAG
jgi:hypothetical protein